jgi:hypothetical protein
LARDFRQKNIVNYSAKYNQPGAHFMRHFFARFSKAVGSRHSKRHNRMQISTQLFTEPPAIIPSILRALFLPRKTLAVNAKLPRLSAQWLNIHIDNDHLARYCELCSIPKSDFLPLLYPHVLAAPLHMWLITHPQFPLRLLGAVHLRNHIIQQRPISSHETLTISCAITSERRTEKGLEFDFTTLVKSHNEIVWEGLTTYFVRGRFGAEDSGSPLADLEKITDAKPVAEWYVAENLAKRYAVITQDYNPIHISKWLAKLFGFQRDLAHGFCILATSMEKAGIKTPADNSAAQRLDVLFKGPMYLGNIARLKKAGERLDLYCGDNDRPSLCIKISARPVGQHLPGITANQAS